MSSVGVVGSNALGTLPRPWIELPISYKTFPPFAAAVDIVWMLLLGLGSGVAYDLIVHSGGGDLRTYVGLAIAVATLFSAFARGAELYKPSSLLYIRRQIKRSVLIWILVFFCLTTIVFVLKIGALFSRGGVLIFFSGGLVVIAVSRVVLARTLAFGRLCRCSRPAADRARRRT